MRPGTIKNLPWPLIITVFILLAGLSFLSEGFYGGADNASHYLISRYSFKHPYLFLDLWGKPVFTIMSSPFSQFGFQGLKLFNVLLACLSALLACLTADKLGIKRSWLAILFVIFTPMYCLMILTGLTEIQFGFILILAVYLFFDEKYIASAIVISFLPLSRSEGFMWLPVFLLAFLMKKKFKPIPFLITGLLFFSVLGSLFVWKDFFWIFTHSPYPLHHPLYKEKGPLLHFINASPEIFGIPLLILFLSGLGLYGYLLITAKKKQRLQVFLETWMLALPVLLFFAFHSLFLWKGWFGSLGLIRVVTGVLPLAAIVSVKAYEHIEKTLIKIRIFRNVFLFMVIILILISNFILHQYPVRLTPEEQARKAATYWIKQSALLKHKILFSDTDIPFLLDMDLWDHTICEQKQSPDRLNSYPENTVFIWDSYYSTHECHIPLDLLEKTGEYRLLNIFRPKLYLNSWNEPYEICIFRKVPVNLHIDNKAIRDSITTRINEAVNVRFIAGDTFEKNPENKDNPHLSMEVARSGSWSYKVPGPEEFTSSYHLDISKIISQKNDVTIRVSCYIYPLIPFRENDTRLVITLKDRGDLYHSLVLDTVATGINQWNKVSFLATFPVIKASDRLVIYFWHLGKKEFYIDDLKIEALKP